VTEAVKEALASAPAYHMGVDLGAKGGDRTAVVRAAPPDKTPTFVPTGIVGAVKGEVSVASQETEDSGVEKAAKALKARKKPARKKPAKAKPKAKPKEA
jgi:hypothetical protein